MANLILPVDTPYKVTTEFGNIAGYTLNNGFHKGIDLVSDNKRIYLICDATIELYPNNGADGNAIYFTQNIPGIGMVRAAYCHMASFAVKAGTYKAGTYLGQMGKTGAADGVHLHLAIRVNGNLVNPRTLIDFEEDQVVDDNFIRAFWEDLFRTQPSDDDKKKYIGTNWMVTYSALRNSDAHKAMVAYINQLEKDNAARADGLQKAQTLISQLESEVGDTSAQSKLAEIKQILEKK